MKIAIFTDTFDPDVNGVAKTLKRFTDYLSNQGIEYRVFAPKSASQSIYSSNIYRFNSLPLFLYPECRIALPNMLHVREELMQFKPDIIHVATPFNVGLCGLHYAKKLNIPLVGSYHTDFDKYLEYYDLQLLTKVLWRYMRWFHRPMRKIFVPSMDTLENLKKHGFVNLDIWPRGIDSAIFHPNFDKETILRKYNIKEKHVLLYVGRIAPEKDVMLLPDIHKQLPEQVRDDVHWLIVGDGPNQDELRRRAPVNMTFTGFLSGEELAHVYAASDVFVFPSPTETFGNVVLEAMASGTPAICANAGGVRTILEHQKTGLLCEEKNSNAFAKAITDLLLDKKKRREMSWNGREYALTQTWDSIFETLLRGYEESIEEKQLAILA